MQYMRPNNIIKDILCSVFDFWASIQHSTLKHSNFLHRLYMSSSILQVAFSKHPFFIVRTWIPSLSKHRHFNTFFLRKNKTRSSLNLEKLKHSWTWLIPHNYISFIIIKTKSVIVPLGQHFQEELSKNKWLQGLMIFTRSQTLSITPFLLLSIEDW